ncbi:PqqD family protein [Albimonas sp. CAU 1670]|uniref:PqqD family protein n=1 Tax=Albimonas sp. CAU 1670 TaxID=3032599 RepID=UPI0023DCBD70|nr:PqqD family protein [Albimonas sp. CAU 1670]MDF2234467.1 PqqD family protein [Albimonas sp. CAU 1670]
MNPTDLLSRSDGVMEARVSDDELVLLGPESEEYFGLDAVASDVWERLETPMTLAELVDALAQDYDAPPERISADLSPAIQSLVDGGLLNRQAAG